MGLLSCTFFQRKCIIISLLFSLLGCGGESSTTSNETEVISPSELDAIVISQDSIDLGSLYQNNIVDLSSRNIISTGEALAISDLINISRNSQCEPLLISNMNFTLDKFEAPTLCSYKYSLKSLSSGIVYDNNNMVAQVIIKDASPVVQNSRASVRMLPSTTLPPIQLSISAPGEVVNIDLTSRLATQFPKDDANKSYQLSNNVLVLGKGTAVVKSDDLNKSVISYSSDVSDVGGITRLLYSLSDDFDGDGYGDFQIGSIDISVHGGGSNMSPVANNFLRDNGDNELIINKKYTINVASQTSDDCIYERKPTESVGSCIFDSDGDKLQLVGVYSYDAQVVPTSLTNIVSTEFDITFERTGIHDVTYEISDHNGGFASGIVRFYVKENLAPVPDNNPYIIIMEESNSWLTKTVNSFASDPDGDIITIKSLEESVDEITVEIDDIYPDKGDARVRIKTGVNSEGVHEFSTVLTDGINDVLQKWVIIVNPANHLSLASIDKRTFSTDTNMPIEIDITSIIRNIRPGKVVSVKKVSGGQYGEVAISSTDESKVIYKPHKNILGIDDFIFEVETTSGAYIAGDVIINIGNPPELLISDVTATEGVNDLISASVICDNCDVSKYEYNWVIDDQVVSTDKSFTITPEQRIYNVTLLVVGTDVFGQKAHNVSIYNFFEIVTGSYNFPATDCQEIYTTYNSPFGLTVDDGEYWLRSADDSYTYKTQCDMVSQAEADELDKSVGGYTLIWSYSEKTNLTRFGGSTDKFSQRSKGVEFNGRSFVDGRGLVTTESGIVDYNNFRVTNDELNKKFGISYSRVTYTSDISIDSINRDVDHTVQDWYMQTTEPVNFYTGSVDFSSAGFESGIAGRLAGVKIDGIYKSSRVVELRNNVGEVLGDMTMYGGAYGFHYSVDEVYNGQYLNNLWGFWGENDHDLDLFGLCTNPKEITLGGVKSLGCNGDTAGAKTYHESINGGEGYVIQWWAL
ncbi:hypothetical protein [Shewanella sp. UCD-KL12]|uniref:hypothetical protein n=1 Tax=Shewanella sp. UCD-KL12 TaxID=1917163 RepID=UPI000970FF3C|nr:hypothetical protein [Shewanella sp. UCD-KL12]